MIDIIVHNPFVHGIKVKNNWKTLRARFGIAYGIEFTRDDNGKHQLINANCGCLGCRGLGDIAGSITIKEQG